MYGRLDCAFIASAAAAAIGGPPCGSGFARGATRCRRPLSASRWRRTVKRQAARPCFSLCPRQT